MKGLLFLALLLTQCPTPNEPTMNDSITLFDFQTDTPADAWRIQDDVVMGGRSSGNFEITDEGHGRFHGEVSLENNGGFSSIQTFFDEPVRIEGADHFLVRLRGDGSDYTFRVKHTADARYWYQAKISTTDGEWQTARVPFAELEPHFRGEQLDREPFPGKEVHGIQFLIGNKRAQEFEVLLDWMSAQ